MFHVQIANGFATVFNDPWDGRIEVALLEHWWNTFRGLEGWQEPLWFSPAKDTLGYNDGYLAFGVLHALFRWCGFDPFLSAELVTLVVRAVGFPGFLLLARQSLRLGFWPALLGAGVFTIANNMLRQVEHAQLVSVSLTPWLWWMLSRAWFALGDGRRPAALAWGVAIAALVDVWVLTAFYTLWFTVLFLCILAAFRARWLSLHWRRLLAWPVMTSGAVFLAGMAPFLATYLPTRHETGGHHFSEVLDLAPRLADMVALGPGNLFWGRMAAGLRGALGWTMAAWGEHIVGWPPVLLATAATGLVLGLRKRDKAWVAIGLATLVATLLPVVWGAGQWTAWRLVYAVVPGAGAIRSTTRFALVLTVPVALLAAYALDTLRWPRFVLASLAAMLVFEEVNLTPMAKWPRGRYLAEAAMPPPPGSCSHFIVKQPRFSAGPEPSILMNVEAMVVAEHLHIPTMNGHASFLPKYQDLSYGDQVEYEGRMATLAMQSGLGRQLCELDLRAGTWAPFRMPETVAPTIGQAYTIDDAGDTGFIAGHGWANTEPAGRWLDGDTGTFVFRNPLPNKPLRLAIRAAGFPPTGPREATISYEGFEVARWYPGPTARTMVAELPPRPDALVSVTIHINRPRSPAELGLGPDTRLLGLFVDTVTLIDPAD